MSHRPLAIVGALLFACASSNTPATSPTDGGTSSTSSCEELASAARSTVSAVIDAHQDCQADADCTLVALSVGNCFDSCSRVVASASVPDVDAAKTKVSGAQCKDFENKGCKATIPPCVPSQTPHCVKNKCSE